MFLCKDTNFQQTFFNLKANFSETFTNPNKNGTISELFPIKTCYSLQLWKEFATFASKLKT